MFCGLGEEERKRIGKKRKNKKNEENKEKKEKTKHKQKRKNLIMAKFWLIGMKGYLKSYNHEKYFFRHFSCFWTRPFLKLIFRGDFRVLKPKSRGLLLQTLEQTYNLLILNCMQLDVLVLEL